MATIDSLITDLQNWTNAGTSILTTAIALECANTAMRRMARHKAWTFLQAQMDLVIPGGTVNSTALPNNFLEEVDVWTVDTTQTDPSNNLFPITRTQRTWWYSAISPLANVDPSFPQVAAPALRSAVTDQRYYYLWNGKLWIVPTPSTALTIRMDYLLSSDLASGQTPQGAQNGFTVLYPDAVRNGGLVEAYRFLQQWEIAEFYEKKFAADLEACTKHDNAQLASGGARQRGI